MATLNTLQNQKKRLTTASCAILTAVMLTLSACHVAQQLIEVVAPSKNHNPLDQKDIKPLTELSLGSQPRSSRHSGSVILVRPLGETPQRVLSVGQDGSIIGWDLSQGSGYLVRKLPGQVRLAAIGESKGMIAWSDETGVFVGCLFGCTHQKELPNFKIRPAALSFHNDDTSLLIGGTDGKIYRWRFFSEQEDSAMEDRDKGVERYMGHQTALTSVVGHSGGRAFFSSDWDGKLCGWLAYTADDFGGDYDKNVLRGRFYTDKTSLMVASRPADRGISSMALSKNGEQIAVGTEDGFVEMWTVKGFFLAARQKLHQGRVTAIAITDDGSRIASIGKDTKVKVSQPVADPSFGIAPNALTKILQEVSENISPSARQVSFVTPDVLTIGSSEGELAEIRIDAVVPPAPTPLAQKPTNAPRDSDY